MLIISLDNIAEFELNQIIIFRQLFIYIGICNVYCIIPIFIKWWNIFQLLFFCWKKQQQKNVKKSEKTSLAPWAIDKKVEKVVLGTVWVKLNYLHNELLHDILIFKVFFFSVLKLSVNSAMCNLWLLNCIHNVRCQKKKVHFS